MKRIISILILVLFSLGATVYVKAQSDRGVPARTSANIVVKTEKAKREDFTFTLEYIGNIKAYNEAQVLAKVPGKLVKYTVSEGERVEKGQTIAILDRDETGLKFEPAKVESPMVGTLGKTLLDYGVSVAAQTTALAIVVDMDNMLVRLNIPEADIPHIKRGLKAVIKVDAYPNEEFSGEICCVSEIVDAQTRTLPIKITIPNADHRLKSGMFARIKIIAAQLKDILVLHQDAIVQELGEKFVFVVKDSIANKQKIIVGRRDNGLLEILEGVKEGDRIIVFGQQGLKDGAAVTVSNNE